MKYQDFFRDENFISREDTIIFSHVKISQLSWLLQSQSMKFIKVLCLIAIIFRIRINATYFLYFSTKIQMCIRSILY